MAPYSLVANTLALPVVGVLVMPFALLSAVLMPLELEAAPLWVMGEGLRLVMAISDWVAGFSGAKLVLAQPAPWKTVIVVAGAVVLCMVQGRLRLAGLPVIALGLALMAVPEPGPDVIVERTGQNVVIRNDEGLLVPALARRSRFSVEKWLAADGDEATPAEAAARSGWSCTKTRCDATVNGQRLAYLMAGEGETLSCEGLDMVIASFPLRGACRNARLRIDRFDLWRQGAHAIQVEEGGMVMTTARGAQGLRPWVVEPRPRATPWRKSGASASKTTD